MPSTQPPRQHPQHFNRSPGAIAPRPHGAAAPQSAAFLEGAAALGASTAAATSTTGHQMGASLHHTARQSAAVVPSASSQTLPQRAPSMEAPRSNGNAAGHVYAGNRETMQNGGIGGVHPAAVAATAEILSRVIANAGR